ncbi:MAG TPA: PAS domain-containing hybrid sensor histidine kinase/response regulator [Spirochaetes bacterium]|nr:PAS domain-containing hybrid sensor histidine kinase/response regulator [Spirochaetota bacterium]
MIYISPAYEKLWNRSCESLYNDPDSWIDSVIKEDREKVTADNKKIRSNDFSDGNTLQYRIVRSDRTVRWILSRSFPIRDGKGEVYRIAGISSDITELKLLEEDLYNAKITAEAANKAKSIFLANMSHELRTPLNSILGFSQVLEMEPDDLTEDQLEYLGYIKTSGYHLLEMVNDILDLSKIEAGKFEIEKKPFSLGSMLSRLPLTIKSLASKKKIKLELNISPEVDLVTADEVRIKQVLYNLLSNAVKFTGSGKRIGIDACVKDCTAIIEVWDEGIGIREEDRDRVFEPFVQVGGAESGKPEGTGLGLAISRRLVNAHGGYISVKANNGPGSRFTVMLPGATFSMMNQTINEDPEPKLEKTETGRRGNILVVEDNELNQRVITSILEPAGYRVHTEQFGKDGAKAGREGGFDLILMDIQLPDMSGVDAMKEIKGVSGIETPVIALTAYAMKGDEKKFLAEGFDGYISKPIDVNNILKTIERFLKK